MGRQGLCTSDKIDTFTSKYPREFEKRKLLGEFVLYCKLCKTKVSCDKKIRVEIHRSGHVHQREIGQLQLTPVVNFFIPNTTTKFDDPIRTYLVNRLENMQDLMDIISCTTGLSPEKTAKLRGAVGSSASIERSFSKLGKLLAEDRNFDAKNVEAYICVYCNNL